MKKSRFVLGVRLVSFMIVCSGGEGSGGRLAWAGGVGQFLCQCHGHPAALLRGRLAAAAAARQERTVCRGSEHHAFAPGALQGCEPASDRDAHLVGLETSAPAQPLEPGEEGNQPFPVATADPCPFLRALERYRFLPAQTPVPIRSLGRLIAAASGASLDKQPRLAFGIQVIALIANGAWPWNIARQWVRGMDCERLRGGLLDKKGAGSGIINQEGGVNAEEFDRLTNFAVEYASESGEPEPGLGRAQLKTMMDENFKRSRAFHKPWDRQLMNGEWPVLLQFIGKTHGPDPYLSVKELRSLFFAGELPQRVLGRLAERLMR